MKGENGTTAFLPLDMKIGRPVKVKYAKDRVAICLTKDWARHTYEKVESDGVVKLATIK